MSRRPRGWIPDQHGAWAMISIPALVGVVIGGPHWRHLPLLLAWLAGYFLFNAASLWLKSGRKTRFYPPVRAYGALSAFLILTALLAAPWLIGWALYFLPLATISTWCMLRRRERSMLNDAVTIAAACLMTMVAFDAATRPDSLLSGLAFDPAGTFQSRPDALAWAWRACAALTCYFLGTVPHVKSLIRERNNPRYFAGSVLYHALVLGVVVLLVALGRWQSPPSAPLIIGAATLALARAAAMPARQRRYGRPWRPVQIGLIEIGMSALMALAVLSP